MDRRGKRKGRNASTDSHKRESSLYTIEEPVMPRPHCDKCQGEEALRAGLDCRCHCENCCELSPRCSSPRMAQLKDLNSCACYLDRLVTAKGSMASPVATKSCKKKKAPTNADAISIPEIRIQEIQIEKDVEMTIKHPKKQESSKCKEIPKLTLPIKRPDLSILKPVKQTKEKRCKAACDTFIGSLSTDTKYRRPHCSKCGVEGCLRKLEQDICYCNTCMSCNKTTCSSPRMNTFRKTHNFCTTTSVRAIKEKRDDI